MVKMLLIFCDKDTNTKSTIVPCIGEQVTTDGKTSVKIRCVVLASRSVADPRGLGARPPLPQYIYFFNHVFRQF